MRFFTYIITAAFLLAAAPALAEDTKAGDITIEEAWTRATPPGAEVGGAYLTLSNEGESDDRLLSATTPIAGQVEIHSMNMTDGVMRMRRLPDGVAIPAGETVKLAPGGMHIMLMGLKEPITQDKQVPLTLHFEKGGKIELELVVSPIGASAPPQQQGRRH